VIAEDLALLRDGLSRLLRDNGFDVVAAVEDGDALTIRRWVADSSRERPCISWPIGRATSRTDRRSFAYSSKQERILTAATRAKRRLSTGPQAAMTPT
jgi:hypothetical protein